MMDKVDTNNSEQNAFVQNWLTQYLKDHPSGSEDEREDDELGFDYVIEAIQGTYNYKDHMKRMEKLS